METKSNGMMPAKAVKNENLQQYEYVYQDGWKVCIDRTSDYPEQIVIRVRNSNHDTVSEMVVWARKDAPV